MRERGGGEKQRSIYKKLLAVKSKSNDILRKWLDGNTDLVFIVVIVVVVMNTHILSEGSCKHIRLPKLLHVK